MKAFSVVCRGANITSTGGQAFVHFINNLLQRLARIRNAIQNLGEIAGNDIRETAEVWHGTNS
jgi:hypothetical protein